MQGKGENNDRVITQLDRWKSRNVEEGGMFLKFFILV